MDWDSIIDHSIGFLGNAQQNYYNREMAEYQNEWNLKMWHLQNEYNSPKATMQRLTDAGINPRAYQQIGTFANAEKPHQAAEMNKISEISAYQGVARQYLENKLLNQQIEKDKANTDYQRALETLTKRKASGQYNKNIIDALQFALVYADYGLELDPSVFKGTEFLRHYQGDEMVPFAKLQPIQKMIQSFNDRYDAKVTSQQLLNQLRQFEAATKEERYRILKEYGVDTESDSIMGAIRLAIRALEKF